MSVGIGYRPEISGALLREPDRVDVVELLLESSIATRQSEREAKAISEVWPVVVHGVKLSLGSAEGIDEDRAARLGTFARDVSASAISEHASFVRAGGVEIGHLTATPFTHEAARVIARNAIRARRHFPDVPFLIENVAWSMRYSEDAMPEGDFHRLVLELSGCELLLDLGNVLANAKNSKVPALTLLDTYPLERVGQIHIAGGLEERGFYFDTHGHAVPDEVFELLAHVIDRVGMRPIVLERDDGFRGATSLFEEMDRARTITAGTPVSYSMTHHPIADLDCDTTPADGLAHLQAEVARTLTDASLGPSTFDRGGVIRSREILREKRIDSALFHLERLSQSGEPLRGIARRYVDSSPRPKGLASVADAHAIAEIAVREPALERGGRLDLLVLDALYKKNDRGTFETRQAPYIAHTATRSGRAWVWKGIGEGARVRLFSPRVSE